MPDAPIPEDIRETMNDIGRTLDKTINAVSDRPMGFILLAFDIGDSGTTSYISNCDREDCVKLMREFVEKQGG